MDRSQPEALDGEEPDSADDAILVAMEPTSATDQGYSTYKVETKLFREGQVDQRVTYVVKRERLREFFADYLDADESILDVRPFGAEPREWDPEERTVPDGTA